MAMIHYVDPAGNMTAIVRGEFGNEKRVELAKQILQQEKAEQVGFEVPPVNGGDCRLEMMGGEFCGNAVRAFAYLKASEQHSGGRHAVKVEISGAANPVMANVDLSAGLAFVQMPKPLGVEEVLVKDTMRPVVHMEGIDHVIMEGVDADEELRRMLFAAMGKWQPNACGILFLKGDEMTPVVYVRSTESLIWESSCGSGSVACAWYLAASTGMLNQDGIYKLKFTEPGGVVEAGVMVKNHEIIQCMMGGDIKLAGEEAL